jgi:acyl transferase domain-containing protein
MTAKEKEEKKEEETATPGQTQDTDTSSDQPSATPDVKKEEVPGQTETELPGEAEADVTEPPAEGEESIALKEPRIPRERLNEVLEKNKELENRLQLFEQQQEIARQQTQPTREQLIAQARQSFPNLFTEDMSDAAIEEQARLTQTLVAQQLQSVLQPVTADVDKFKRESQKTQLKNAKPELFKKYGDEVDKVFKSLPIEKQNQPGAYETTFYSVLGKKVTEGKLTMDKKPSNPAVKTGKVVGKQPTPTPAAPGGVATGKGDLDEMQKKIVENKIMSEEEVRKYHEGNTAGLSMDDTSAQTPTFGGKPVA